MVTAPSLLTIIYCEKVEKTNMKSTGGIASFDQWLKENEAGKEAPQQQNYIFNT